MLILPNPIELFRYECTKYLGFPVYNKLQFHNLQGGNER